MENINVDINKEIQYIKKVMETANKEYLKKVKDGHKTKNVLANSVIMHKNKK